VQKGKHKLIALILKQLFKKHMFEEEVSRWPITNESKSASQTCTSNNIIK